MEQITRYDVRQDLLIDVLSMAVLHCRQEIHKLDYDAASVLGDIDEYRRLLRNMNIALNILEAVGDLGSSEFVSISGDGSMCEDGVTPDTITHKKGVRK